MMKKMGLVKGRHSLPVGNYIFDEIEDVLGFLELELQAQEKLLEAFPEFVENEITPFYNEVEHTDIYRRNRGDLHLYVTGLSSALVAVMNVCTELGIHLNLYHYDRERDTYMMQETRI